LFVTLACAIAGALGSDGKPQSFAGQVILIALWVLGPLLRSWERERVKWSFVPNAAGAASTSTRLSGTIPLVERSLASGDQVPREDAVENVDEMIKELRLALVRRGLIPAKGSSFDSFDLRIIVPPFVRVAVLFLTGGDDVSLRWRTGAAGWRIAASLAALLIMLLVGGFSIVTAAVLCGLASAAVGTIALRRASRVPAVLSAASLDLAAGSQTASQAYGGKGRRPSLP
jgi:hypothetical protein